MRYRVYVDVLFGNCLIMDYWILSLTGMLLQRHATRRRKLLCAALGALLTVCCMLSARMPEIMRAAVCYGGIPFLALRAAYGIGISGEMLSGCVCMFLLTFLYGGCYTFLQRNISALRGDLFTLPVLLAISAAVYELLVTAFAKLRKKARLRRVQAASRYLVQFGSGEAQVCCAGILDTGNHLYDPLRGIPAAVMDKDAFPLTRQTLPSAVIPYRSLGCKSGLLYAYLVRNVWLYPEEEEDRECVHLEEMLIALYDGELSSGHEYRMLLHPDFFFTQSKKETQKRGMDYDFQSGDTGKTEDVSSAQGICVVCAEKK